MKKLISLTIILLFISVNGNFSFAQQYKNTESKPSKGVQKAEPNPNIDKKIDFNSQSNQQVDNKNTLKNTIDTNPKASNQKNSNTPNLPKLDEAIKAMELGTGDKKPPFNPLDKQSNSNDPPLGDTDPDGFGNVESTEKTLDTISIGGGVIDPPEMGGIDPKSEAGERKTCADGSCVDGTPKDPLPEPSIEDLDICAQGDCLVNPIPEKDKKSEGGDLDPCQVNPATCESGDDREEQETAKRSDDECEEGDTKCEQDSTDDDDSDSDGEEERQASEGYDDPKDSDGDGLSDSYEKNNGTDPNKSDTDGDGASDSAEDYFGSDPKDPYSTPEDLDGDFLSNELEIAAGTDPKNKDSDHDGLLDGFEVHWGNTNPTEFDTDGDGWNDSAEKKFGTDPNDSTSCPRDHCLH